MLNRRSLVATLMFTGLAIAGSVPEANAQDRSVWLYNGESTTVEGYFYAGENIYGSCDQDCADLDLFLYNSSGQLVDNDVAVDSVPIVTAPYEGNYTIEVSMPNCTHSAGCEAWVSSDHGF